MTPPDVSDAAVEAACDARLRALMHATNPTTEREAMRAAIAAALEVMIVPAHFATDGAGDFTLFAEFTDLDHAYAYAGDDGWVVEAYSFRNQDSES